MICLGELEINEDRWGGLEGGIVGKIDIIYFIKGFEYQIKEFSFCFVGNGELGQVLE